jgi:hypothetical protein
MEAEGSDTRETDWVGVYYCLINIFGTNWFRRRPKLEINRGNTASENFPNQSSGKAHFDCCMLDIYICKIKSLSLPEETSLFVYFEIRKFTKRETTLAIISNIHTYCSL